MTFVDDVLAGRVMLEDVETYREAWNSSGEDAGEYHEFLGLLWPEYAMYVEDDDVLACVVEARRAEQDLLSWLTDHQDSPVATRLLALAQRYSREWAEAQRTTD
ncbi:hypothetical protein ACIQVL_49455 [Streptomyces sp. NPDC090499]|uniref:hypothetical protein n=1 Tax=Streptomyces sp. NPDC090499 TaxID=3365965 RepID=UPI0037F3DDD3